MERLRALSAVILLLCCTLSTVVASIQNPCTEAPTVRRGDRFVVGLAFFVGFNATFHGDPALNPCTSGAGISTPGNEVEITYFETRVDRLQMLKIPFKTLHTLYRKSSEPRMLSVIAFSGAIRSPARYVVSSDKRATTGTGWVESLVLLPRFEKGVLLYLQWYDLKCNDCGGPDSEYCINSVSCTLPFDDCKPTNETIGLDDPTLDACATGITVAFAGSDSKGKAFASGSNVKRLNAYSLAELYVDGKERLSSPGKFGGA